MSETRFRVVCRKCNMTTGRMSEGMAREGAKAHADENDHRVEVVYTWEEYNA